MTIQINRGLLGDRSLIVSLVGSTADGTSSVDQWVRVDSLSVTYGVDPDAINIIDNNLTTTENTTMYYLQEVHYSEWLDSDGNTFPDSQSVVNYIQNIINNANDYYNIVPRLSVGSTTEFTIPVNTNFSSKVEFDNAVNYFWERSDFQGSVDVSRFDNRVITGIISTAALYEYTLNVQTITGISSVSVYLNVV